MSAWVREYWWALLLGAGGLAPVGVLVHENREHDARVTACSDACAPHVSKLVAGVGCLCNASFETWTRVNP